MTVSSGSNSSSNRSARGSSIGNFIFHHNTRKRYIRCNTILTNKNIKRHTAHTIVSWPNPKQWVIVNIFTCNTILTNNTLTYHRILTNNTFICMYYFEGHREIKTSLSSWWSSVVSWNCYFETIVFYSSKCNLFEYQIWACRWRLI